MCNQLKSKHSKTALITGGFTLLISRKQTRERKCLWCWSYSWIVITVLLFLFPIQKVQKDFFVIKKKRDLHYFFPTHGCFSSAFPSFLKYLAEHIRLLSVAFVHFNHHTVRKHSLLKKVTLAKQQQQSYTEVTTSPILRQNKEQGL